jgi:hypothetical protein
VPGAIGSEHEIVAAPSEPWDPRADGGAQAQAGAVNELSDPRGRCPESRRELRLVVIAEDGVQQCAALIRRQAGDRVQHRVRLDHVVHVGAVAQLRELGGGELAAALVKVVDRGAAHSGAQVRAGLLDLRAAGRCAQDARGCLLDDVLGVLMTDEPSRGRQRLTAASDQSVAQRR